MHNITSCALVMFALQKVNVIRRHQPETELPRQLRQRAVAFPLLRHPMIVQLNEKILRAKDVAIIVDAACLRLREIIGL